MKSCERDVDELDADERHDEAAQSVDEQIASQNQRRSRGRYFTPRSASGMSAMMTSALKITELRIAEPVNAGA